MTGSLAFRKNEAAIRRGVVPEKYTRLLPHIPRGRILEIGSAEGVLALLLAKRGDRVAALELSPERFEAALGLRDEWALCHPSLCGVRFFQGNIADNLFLLNQTDTLVAVRMIYYLGDQLDALFAAAAEKVSTVVLCGNKNRAARWRAGTPDEPLGEMNRYAAREGMIDVLERHGFEIVTVVTDGDEIVVGRRA